VPLLHQRVLVPPPAALFAENKRLKALASEQQNKLSNLATQEVTANTANALIAQYDAIIKYLNTVANDYASLQKDVAGKPYTDFIAEVDTGLALVLALIDDIRKLYLPNLRRVRDR
jgi:DNA-binding transcriptional regulator YbjK